MFQVSLELKRFRLGVQDFKYNKVPLLARKTWNIYTSMSAAPKLKSFIRIEMIQVGAHDLEYNNVPLFARKTGNVNTSMSASPKLALVPAIRYNCDVNWPYHNECAKIH